MPDTARLRHTPEERRQALVVFGSCDGRQDLVVPALKEAGLPVKFNTLKDWAYSKHRDEYEQIKQEYDAYLRSQRIDTFRAAAGLAAQVSTEAMRQLHEALKRGEVSLKELPKAAASAMVTAGIATDKGERLSGNPTQRVDHSVDDLKSELASVGITIVLPGQPEPAKLDDQRKPALPAGAK